jgi:serine phosphatase RsbU (regulator of sigma subunit)
MNTHLTEVFYEQILSSQQPNVNPELLKSLRYAAGIQKAIYPPKSDLKKINPNSFIFFKPKELVSGDFYWFKEFNDEIILVVGDCTGHGVPGAFMSILGIIYLNEIVTSGCSVKANRILNALRERIMHLLNQSGEALDVKDGMDMALVKIHKKKQNLQFAGANNPLYLLRNKELVQFRGDRMPVGVGGAVEKPFTNIEVELKNNDTIYLFTDGFVDQFGGDEGKKLKYKRFRNILLRLNDVRIDRKEEVLGEAFDQWKGEEEQIDDVLVMGYKFRNK